MWFGIAVLLTLSFVPALARAAIARLAGIHVPRLMIGFGPKLAAWTIGRTRWQLHAIPVAAFSQIAGLHATDAPVAPDAPDAFGSRPWLSQLLVLLGGVLGLFVFSAAVSIAGNLAFGIVDVDSSRAVVDTVVPNRPAAAAGLLGGDEIVAVEGAHVDRMEALAPALNATHGPVRLTIRRQGAEQMVVITPEDVGGARRIGVTLTPGDVVRRVEPGRAIVDGAVFPVRYVGFLLNQIGQQFVARRPAASVAGPIGVVRVISQSRNREPRMVLGMVGVFAVYFALWLLVPVPPTDGSRVLWWAFRRRKVSLAAPVDAGIVSPTKETTNPAWVVLVTFVGIVAVAMLAAAGLGLVVAFVFVGLLRRRAWAWGVTRTASLYLAGSSLLMSIVMRDATQLVGFALFLTIALLSRAASVRLLFGLRCPVCGAIEGEPVLGAPRALQCRACGSSWAVALVILPKKVSP